MLAYNVSTAKMQLLGNVTCAGFFLFVDMMSLNWNQGKATKLRLYPGGSVTTCRCWCHWSQ